MESDDEILVPGTESPSKDLVLEGKWIRLQPVDPEKDYQELYARSHGSPENEAVWKYMWRGPYKDENDFLQYLKSVKDDPKTVGFTVVNKPTNEKIGMITYLNIVPSNRTIEIGSIWYTPKFQRTYANTESCYLTIKYAFENLKYRRVEWKCNNLNERSRAAALRLGFKYEGLFRQHMIVKGKSRDSAYFSIIDKEWEEVKKNLESKLYASSSNLDY
eukprot:CAMPEP_0168566328 /NCGR_PEP_ID=MMETSP0413-20121227/14359_1 /TAXON_ID=136452 /ORGANISM="Filamoeba nolandi, Strain NC-AS-23-1" /LENGTH=216 /DNA_ID=CAMNT_0008598337 /DNA_START=20 /DNA_END=668 /DNA_ORIENTATION=+